MNSMSFAEELHKKGLKKVTYRPLSLLTMSVVGNAYNVLMRERIGFGYEIAAAIGNESEFYTLFNESKIIDNTEKLLIKDKTKALCILSDAKKDSDSYFSKIKSISINGLTKKELSIVLSDLYPKQLACLAVYNCFWRFIGDEESKYPLSKDEVQKISIQRQSIAQDYAKIESIISDSIKEIALNGDKNILLLKSMTISESINFLDNKLSHSVINRIKKRKKQYLYIIEKGKEKIITDRNIVSDIRKEFLVEEVDTDLKIIKGKSAFVGLIKGKVRIVNSLKDSFSFLEGEVLVSANTDPSFVPIMKKAIAIVADEGGIMSHAAIVSRELKIPCIVGTKIATKVLHDGDLVEVDANSGLVKIIKKAQN